MAESSLEQIIPDSSGRLPTCQELYKALQVKEALAKAAQAKAAQPGRQYTLAGIFAKQAQGHLQEAPEEALAEDSQGAAPSSAAQSDALVAAEPPPVPEDFLAEFEVPEKIVTKPTLADKEVELILSGLNQQSQGQGPAGQQGAWQPGPGRGYKKKQPTVTQLPESTALALKEAGVVSALVTADRQPRLSSRLARKHKRKQRTDFSPEERHLHCLHISEDFKKLGLSRKGMWQRWAGLLDCTPDTVRKMYDKKEVWAQRQALAAKIQGSVTGNSPGKPVKGPKNGSTGQRQAGQRGYLGPEDWLHLERKAVRVWAHQEEENGHSLGRWDLFRQLRRLAQRKVEALTDLQEQQELSEVEQACLKFVSGRLEAWHKPKAREKAALKLLKQTGFRERATNRKTALSAAGEKVLLEKAWRFFDFANWLVPNGSFAELADFFGNPQQFRLNFKETVLLWTDQIPVWLKVEAGLQLVSERTLKELRAGKKKRQARRKQAAKKLARSVAGQQPAPEQSEAEGDLAEEPVGSEGQSYLAKGPGDANASRWRVTLLARQVVEHWFDPGQEPVGHQG